jgi:hypothetical protein
VTDYLYKTTPFEHQARAFLRSRDELYFALLMEMGTGKTKVVIDTAAWLFAKREIRMLIVVAPKGVHRNWITKELPVHMPEWVDYRAVDWQVNGTKRGDRQLDDVCWGTEHKGLRVVVFNTEAFSANGKTCRARKLVERLCNSMACMISVDESTRIKSPSALCTKNLLFLGKRARYRRIMTGLPVTKWPLDVYSQFLFLSPDCLGYDNHWVFKHQYAEWSKERNWKADKDFEKLVGYKNLDELVANIDRHSFRVTKRECLDLPPKMYVVRPVEMTAEQATWYERLRKAVKLEFEGGTMTMAIMLVRMLRLQQVLGGWVTNDNGETLSLFERLRDNPRIAEMLAAIEETSGKVIVWARFKHEVRAISAALRHVYGTNDVVEYYGETSDADRAEAVARFQGERAIVEGGQVVRVDAVPPAEQARFFVGNQECAGIGLTLTMCDTMIYYSNTYNLEDRLQSEDRAHRIGLTHPVTYVDFEVAGTIDTNIIESLAAKFDIAKQITRDAGATWLARSPA